MPGYLFSCETLTDLNGYKLKAAEPDPDGFYECVIGCLGVPTRMNVVYDTQSVIDAMKDTSTRFNICLRDGNLCGELGHPKIETESDNAKAIARLLEIDEKNISHYFRKIWVESEPIRINGMEALAIRAKIKPTGPKGDSLDKSFRDPYLNTAFSIRSLAMRDTGPDPRYDYRKVQVLVTFDSVHAPGFEITSKRYNNSVIAKESYSIPVTKSDLLRAKELNAGCESATDIDEYRINAMFKPSTIYVVDKSMCFIDNSGTDLIDSDGNHISAASLMYGRNR